MTAPTMPRAQPHRPHTSLSTHPPPVATSPSQCAPLSPLAPCRNIKQLMTWAAAWSNISGTLATTAAYAVAATTQLHSAVRLARITASSMPYDPGG